MEMTMKTNRLFITIMMAAIFSCGNMLAQNAQAPNQKKKLTPEQRQEMQINRMQKSLMLDDETAAKFAPLYKEYLEALKACRTEMKQEKPQQRKAERTDAEIKKATGRTAGQTEESGRNQTNVSGQVRKDSECPPAGEIICCTSSQQTYASRSLCTPVQ